MECFANLRMNSHYDIAYNDPGHGNFRRAHPGCSLMQGRVGS